MQLVLSNNSAANPLSLDVSKYINAQDGSGMDPADPEFSSKVWGRSLLKEGATLALENVTEKGLTFPLRLNAASSTALQTLIQQINAIITTPGATAAWSDDGVTQPTVFDLLSGQLDIEYGYRKAQKFWTDSKLRLFAQPFGRTAGPRAYATASGVGPLLMITPYASGGGQVIGASTQAGVAGFGGIAQGGVPSGGIFYPGSPSLAGDAPAVLEISYVGPLPNQATNTGVVPYAAVSLLPDPFYSPLISAPQISFANLNSSTNRRNAITSVASSYVQLNAGASASVLDMYSFQPIGAPSGPLLEPAVSWSGQQRLLAIARASSGNLAGGLNATLALQGGPLVAAGQPTVQLPTNGIDWGLYDLGTFSLRPSEYPQAPVQIKAGLTAGASAALDLAALIMLPDKDTWFLNPGAIQPSQYGYPPNLASQWAAPNGAYTNTLLLHDVVGDQFIYSGASQTFAPSPVSAVPSSARITQYTRGLVPHPDPKNGLPIIAIVGVGQAQDAALSFVTGGGAGAFGPNGPVGASDSSAVGTVAWSNPANIEAADGVYAQASLTAGTISHYLIAGQFGFNIPSAATIVGIQVDVLKLAAATAVSDSAVYLTQAGAVVGTNKASGPWPTGSAAYTSYGGSADLWGTSWAPADINGAGFGVALAATSVSNKSAQVDFVRITVSFTIPATSQFLGASQANPQNLQTMAQVSVLERARYVFG